MKLKVKLKDLIIKPFIFYKKGTKSLNDSLKNINQKVPENTEDINTIILIKPIIITKIAFLLSGKVGSYRSFHYDWGRLRDEMFGGTHTTYGIIKVREGRNKKYDVVDGRHRIKLLKDTYPEDYEVQVEVVPWIENTCPSCRKENILKYFNSFVDSKKKKLNMPKVLEGIQTLSTIIYIVLNFSFLIGMILAIAAFMLTTLFLNFIGYDPSKIAKSLPIRQPLLRQIIMTILINIPMILAIVPMTILVISIILNAPIQFLIYGLILITCEQLIKRFDDTDD